MRPALRWLTQEWTLKLAGIGIALLLWVVVKSEDVVTVAVANIPVRVSIRDPGWELATAPMPSRVSLQVTGPVREVLHLLVDRPRVVVPVEGVVDSVQVLVLRSGWVQFPEDVVRTRVEDLRPPTIRLVFDPVAVRELPVYLPIRGRLPAGLALSGPVLLDPGTVRVSGPRRRVASFDSVPLPLLDLGHLTDTTTIRMDIDTAALGLQIQPSSVRVRIAIGPAAPPAAHRAATRGRAGPRAAARPGSQASSASPGRAGARARS